MMDLKARQKEIERTHWTGPLRRYDIVKEGIIACIVVAALVIGLSALFSSPDDKALTFRGWATAMPKDFFATTVKELAGTSDSATYGPPYNASGDGQAVGPITMQKWIGVHEPIHTANDFVINPLIHQQQAQIVQNAVVTWLKASPAQQATWATNLDNAIQDPKGANGDPSKVPNGDYGPTPLLASGLLAMASSGALDGILPAPGDFYNSNNTKQILFMGDGSYLPGFGDANHLSGNQGGMLNEIGDWPGQQWLMPVSFWYQMPFVNSDATSGLSATMTANGDVYVLAIITIIMLLHFLIPFIPGLRDIPRWIPVHKLIWRQYYRRAKQTS